MRRSAILFGGLLLAGGGVVGFETGLATGRRPVAFTADRLGRWRADAELAADADALRRRATTEDRLGVLVTWPAGPLVDSTQSGICTGRPAEWPRVRSLLPALLAELDRYAPAAVRRIGLRRVVVCQELRAAGQPEWGTADGSTGTIYLAVASAEGDSAMFRHVVHHELFHLIDAAAGTTRLPDPAWTAGNPPGFRYGNGGFRATTQDAGTDMTSAVPGFVTTYSRSGIEEDKAELYGWLMADPDGVRARAAVDPTLRPKLERLRAIVDGYGPDPLPDVVHPTP